MGVAHTRVELFGTLCSGAERWSASFSTPNPGGGGLADVALLATTALTLFQNDYWTVTGILNNQAPATALSGARVRQMNAAGVTMAVGETVLATPIPGTGGGSTTALPPQCSIVASLRTGTPGARHRGRMYLPAFGSLSLTSTGRLAPSIRNDAASAMGDFLNDWNTDPNTLAAGVASGVGAFVESVTSVLIGDVIDTQRRRRDALPESYAAATVTP